MSDLNFQMQALRDPRLSVHATSVLPAWLWSADGTHVIWANPVASKLLGTANAAELAGKVFSPADSHRRQISQLAARLAPSGAVRVERLRGFGAPLFGPVTCACSRMTFENGTTAILVVSLEQIGRLMPFEDRLKSLVTSFSKPSLAFATDGTIAATNEGAKSLSTYLSGSSTNEFEGARIAALDRGEAKFETDLARGVFYRVGSGHEVALISVFDAIQLPDAAQTQCEPIHSAIVAQNVQPELPAPAEQISETKAQEPANTDRSVLPQQQVSEPADVLLPETVTPKSDIAATLAEMDSAHPSPRRHPLRFMWQMDSEGRFSLGSDEFTRLLGPRVASAFGRPWTEIAENLGLDPQGDVAKAVATRATWSGILVNWPSDNTGGRLPVELSGLPIFDRDRTFIGYRGFGVCRDLEGLARLATQRHDEMLHSAQPPKRDDLSAPPNVVATQTPDAICDSAKAIPQEAAVDTPINVVPFRTLNEPKQPALTSVESNAFDELARRLAATLEGETGLAETEKPISEHTTTTSATEHLPAFLEPEAMPLTANSTQDTPLLDRIPIGLLVYRLDRLMYANRSFLDATGFNDLHQLTEAGGLDALYVEPTSGAGASTTESGTPVVISPLKPGDGETTSKPVDARLFSISWDGEPAMALIFSGAATELPVPVVTTAAAIASDSTLAEDLSTILDTTTEGIVMFDGLGRIVSCNRGAEALFGRTNDEIAALNLIDLFAPESQREVLAALENAKSATIASLLDHGREMLGRTRDGRTIPLSMTMGRTRTDGARFFAVFKDQTPTKKSESDIREAQRQTERAIKARSEVLARISHEVRMPLNAIIGFADVMIEERFGPLGNERYAEYMKDIRASGQRVMTIIDDLLDLSRIESGSMDLAFANQDLNSLIEQCVAVMQPQANRERIIIRTSLAHALPSVKADARALRQIALNMIGSSIHLANAGGQVIVSTATTDFGDIVLRVRDTGHGMNDNEIAAAMAPFRTAAALDQISPDNSRLSLSLTKALVEANRAKFQIRSAAHAGTLIEVVFSNASAIA